MKKWLFRILFLMTAVGAIFCFTGFDVTCDGEFKGVGCNISSCKSCDGCDTSCRHSYKIIEEVKATCTEDGYIKSECKKCHHIETARQYKLGHDFDSTTTLHRGICSEGDDKYADGSWYNYCVCTRCDYIEKDYFYEGFNVHFYDEGKVTSSDECGCGEMTYTCLICNNKKVFSFGHHSDDSPQQQELNELYEHNTCGVYLKTCELCHRSVTKVWHRYTQDEYLVLPTETEYGLMKSTCINSHCTTSDNRTIYSLVPPTGQN